jgi:putative AdoMet-dependent methyltransferase
MDSQPVWQWNEIQQVGTDYADAAEVERYERRMGEIRNLAAEDAAILKILDLPPNSRILEIGTGPGHFARAAARAGHRVTALDVSPVMLEYARSKAEAEGLSGIEFIHGGFLTYSAPPATFDAAVSVMALHHLPDVWKAVALQNVHRALKPETRFLVCDFVFSWTGSGHAACFEKFIGDCPPGMRQEAAVHAAKEFSTLDWIMEGLLRRAGFEILRTVPDRAALVQYVCRAEPIGSTQKID